MVGRLVGAVQLGGVGQCGAGPFAACVNCACDCAAATPAAATHQSSCSSGNLQFLGVATIGHVGMMALRTWLRGLGGGW